MSDRSDQALRERLELAKQAGEKQPGTWESRGTFGDAIVWRDVTDKNDKVTHVVGRIRFEITAAHIAASSPDVVRADLEEILALRAEVARLNREADWLAEHLHRAGAPCPGDGEKFDPYGECAEKDWPCVACFREWARQETQEGE